MLGAWVVSSPLHTNLPHLSSSHRYLKTHPDEKKTPVEGLTGRQAHAGETMEKPLARKLVHPPQVFPSTSFHLVGLGKSFGFLNIALAH
jgi:hypothetical protein